MFLNDSSFLTWARGRHIDHTDSGKQQDKIIHTPSVYDHQPWWLDLLAQCCWIGGAKYISSGSCEQVPNRVEQLRLGKEEENSSYVRMSYLSEAS